MPAVSISPILNAWQGFTSSGLPLSGGFINTYLAGTTTPVLSYTDSAGTIANANPITLDSAGRPPSPIWLINGTSYKFVITNSLAADSRTFDNIIGVGTTTGNGSFADLTVTGNTLLGDAQTDTLNVGNGDIIKDNAGYMGFGVAPTAGQGKVQLAGSANGGMKLGNQNNTYGNSLDWYEESTFTPVLYVGGLVSDSTYSSQSGQYTRIGNLVYFELTLQLNVKGVATGGLTIRGMPYVPIAPFAPAGVKGSLLNLVSPGWLIAQTAVAGGVASISLFTSSTVGGVSALETVLANSCTFEIAGFYRVA